MSLRTFVDVLLPLAGLLVGHVSAAQEPLTGEDRGACPNYEQYSTHPQYVANPSLWLTLLGN